MHNTHNTNVIHMPPKFPRLRGNQQIAVGAILYHIIQTKLNHDHDQICAVKGPLSV